MNSERERASQFIIVMCVEDDAGLTDEAVLLLRAAVNALKWSPESEAIALEKLREIKHQTTIP